MPRKGKFITNPDARTIDELYSLRRIVEPFAAQLAIQKLDAAGEESLHSAVADLKEAVNREDPVGIAQSDISFHAQVYVLADHKPLWRTWGDIISNKLRLLVNVTSQTHNVTDPGPNHELIVSALLDRNVELARRVLVEHIDDGWKRARPSSPVAAEAAAPLV